MLHPRCFLAPIQALAVPLLLLSAVLPGCSTACSYDSQHCAPSFLAGAGFASPLTEAEDADRDGIRDSVESTLAARYAPVVTLPHDDTTRPVSLEWLARRIPVQLTHADDSSVAEALRDLPSDVRKGSDDPADWVTYVHVYPSRDGGVLVQYWFFYPFNDGLLWFDHVSDWEHVTVSLDAALEPLGIYAAQHGDNAPGSWRAWDRVRKLGGTHPEILSAKGSHAWYFVLSDVRWQDVAARCESLDGPCWHTQWQTRKGGGLRNLGELHAPLDPFVMTHRGLWGSAGLLPGMSSPSGPAFQKGWCAEGSPACAQSTVF